MDLNNRTLNTRLNVWIVIITDLFVMGLCDPIVYALMAVSLIVFWLARAVRSTQDEIWGFKLDGCKSFGPVTVGCYYSSTLTYTNSPLPQLSPLIHSYVQSLITISIKHLNGSSCLSTSQYLCTSYRGKMSVKFIRSEVMRLNCGAVPTSLSSSLGDDRIESCV
jgi:hypothetical protein